MRLIIDGAMLVCIYRVSIKAFQLVFDEFAVSIGLDNAEPFLPIFTFASWMLAGYIARKYYERLYGERSIR